MHFPRRYVLLLLSHFLPQFEQTVRWPAGLETNHINRTKLNTKMVISTKTKLTHTPQAKTFTLCEKALWLTVNRLKPSKRNSTLLVLLTLFSSSQTEFSCQYNDEQQPVYHNCLHK